MTPEDLKPPDEQPAKLPERHFVEGVDETAGPPVDSLPGTRNTNQARVRYRAGADDRHLQMPPDLHGQT
jgi:hypothetical protein